MGAWPRAASACHQLAGAEQRLSQSLKHAMRKITATKLYFRRSNLKSLEANVAIVLVESAYGGSVCWINRYDWPLYSGIAICRAYRKNFCTVSCMLNTRNAVKHVNNAIPYWACLLLCHCCSVCKIRIWRLDINGNRWTKPICCLLFFIRYLQTCFVYSVLTECQKRSWLVVKRALNIYLQETYRYL